MELFSLKERKMGRDVVGLWCCKSCVEKGHRVCSVSCWVVQEMRGFLEQENFRSDQRENLQCRDCETLE